jgi:hypothetical protein
MQKTRISVISEFQDKRVAERNRQRLNWRDDDILSISTEIASPSSLKNSVSLIDVGGPSNNWRVLAALEGDHTSIYVRTIPTRQMIDACNWSPDKIETP